MDTQQTERERAVNEAIAFFLTNDFNRPTVQSEFGKLFDSGFAAALTAVKGALQDACVNAGPNPSAQLRAVRTLLADQKEGR